MPIHDRARDGRAGATTWPARVLVVLIGLVAAGTATLLAPPPAEAHPLSTTAVLLDIGQHVITGQVQLPIDRLAIALDEPLTPALIGEPGNLERMRNYVAAHTTVTDLVGGAPWTTAVEGGRVETVDNTAHLVLDLVLRPPDGEVRVIRLAYDAIVHRLLSHRIFVSTRPAGTDTYTALGLLDWENDTLAVPAGSVGIGTGFLAALRLGVLHITEGADHLLFLVMLLLPAPLIARRGRWTSGNNLRRSCVRILHVVTAFAVGHSITLALAALGYLDLPGRVVESLIALSILVSAIHAVRPVVRGGEVWIAAGFGLMHGLAFATLLGGLDLGTGSLVTELLGFNLGIELSQLFVVALIMPSLIVLSGTRLYPVVRTALAGLGILLAAAWLAERTTLIRTNPLDVVATILVEHPFHVTAVLACVAAGARLVPRLRQDADGEQRTSRSNASSSVR